MAEADMKTAFVAWVQSKPEGWAPGTPSLREAYEAGAAWAEGLAAKRIAEMNEIYKGALEQAMIPPAEMTKEDLDNWQEPLAYFQERLVFILLEKRHD